jgi:hypothetical protein
MSSRKLQRALDEIDAFLRDIVSLEKEETRMRAAAILSAAIKLIDSESLMRLRIKLDKLGIGNGYPDLMNIVDGQIALREIADTEAWR